MSTLRTTLWRLLAHAWIIVIAVAAGWATAALFRYAHLDSVVPGAGEMMVDAITGALGSSITVYVLALTVQYDAVRRAAGEGVADGVLGDLVLPNPFGMVRDAMEKLPAIGGGKKLHCFVVRPPKEFGIELEKMAAVPFEGVALGFFAGTPYGIDEIKAALTELIARYRSRFRHILVLDPQSQNIMAVGHISSGLAAALWWDDNTIAVETFRDFLKRDAPGLLQSLRQLGFVTDQFEVTSSPRKLFSDFVDAEASEALLSFNNGTVLGTISLWKLVSLALLRFQSRK